MTAPTQKRWYQKLWVRLTALGVALTAIVGFANQSFDLWHNIFGSGSDHSLSITKPLSNVEHCTSFQGTGAQVEGKQIWLMHKSDDDSKSYYLSRTTPDEGNRWHSPPFDLGGGREDNGKPFVVTVFYWPNELADLYSSVQPRYQLEVTPDHFETKVGYFYLNAPPTEAAGSPSITVTRADDTGHC